MNIASASLAIWVAALFLFMASTPGHAGPRNLTDRSAEIDCHIHIRGSITKAATSQLQSEYSVLQKEHSKKKFKDTESITYKPTLCLDSPGGDFNEALKIIDWLIETTNVRTLVKDNATCLSACALIFMFGNNNEGDGMFGPDRRIGKKAKLGFHTPYISPAVDSADAQIAAAAYRAGIKAIGNLLSKDDTSTYFPKSLLVESLKKEPHEHLFVDTVARAAEWSIEIVGITEPTTITRRMLEAACLNSARFEDNRWMRRWWGAGASPTGQRERLTSDSKPIAFESGRHRSIIKDFGSENSYVCAADAFKIDGLIYVYTQFGAPDDPQHKLKPLLSYKRARSLGGAGADPIWFLFPGSTRIERLP